MVAPLVAAAGRVVAKKAAAKVASDNIHSGVRNAQKATRLSQVANDNRQSVGKINRSLRQKDNDNDTHNFDSSTGSQFEKTPRIRQPIEKRVGRIKKILDAKPQSYHRVKSKMLLRAALVPVRMIVFIFTPGQVVCGILTLATYSTLLKAENMTFGFSNWILPDWMVYVFWLPATVSGLVSLVAIIFCFIAIGRIPVFKSFLVLSSLIFLLGLLISPWTCFIPTGLIFTLIVYARFSWLRY